ADRGRSVITDATASLAADVVIVLVHIPQSAWPTADETLPSYKRPIFIFDQRPQLGSQTRQADRARVPTVTSFFNRLLASLCMRFGNSFTAFFEKVFPIWSRLTLYFFNQERQSRLCVAGNGEVGLRHRLKVLNVALHEKVERADANALCICRHSAASL